MSLYPVSTYNTGTGVDSSTKSSTDWRQLWSLPAWAFTPGTATTTIVDAMLPKWTIAVLSPATPTTFYRQLFPYMYVSGDAKIRYQYQLQIPAASTVSMFMNIELWTAPLNSVGLSTANMAKLATGTIQVTSGGITSRTIDMNIGSLNLTPGNSYILAISDTVTIANGGYNVYNPVISATNNISA